MKQTAAAMLSWSERTSPFQVARVLFFAVLRVKAGENVLSLCLDSMTVGHGAASGADGASKAARKLEGGEDEESAAEQPSTKRDGEEETLLPSAAVRPGSTPSLSSSSSSPNPSLGSPPHGQDQHHFLRSSVRPPSKRIRKELASPAVNGHSGARARG